MKISLSSTPDIVELDGVQCRIWVGKSEKGTKVVAYVHRLACETDAEAEELERDLIPKASPGGAGGVVIHMDTFLSDIISASHLFQRLRKLSMDLESTPGIRIEIAQPYFECPACHARSHNPNDIENFYCGRCHQFKEL